MHSSTSSENDTLQAAQEDSKEEDAINDDELQEENENKTFRISCEELFQLYNGWEGCSGSFCHGNWMQYKKPSQQQRSSLFQVQSLSHRDKT